MLYDVAIIGGSYAGLAAALPLARARRKVILIDHGQRRNRFADHSHGFLTQDGAQAATIAKIAKDQVLLYPTVEWQDGEVQDVAITDHQIHICINKTHAIRAKRLIIATGTTDVLPDIKGLTERWGKSVFHCPYCHGYELHQGHIGVIYSSSLSLHLAQLLPDWGTTTLLLNGHVLTDETINMLQARKINIVADEILEINQHANVILKNHTSFEFDGLFVATKMQVQPNWIRNLGLQIEQSEMGEIIQTDALKLSSITHVYACGDVARFAGSVTFAVADGSLAGIAAHRSLIFNAS